jgi:hypothetical protein
MDRRVLARSAGFLHADDRDRSGGNSMHPRGSARDRPWALVRSKKSAARQRFHGG